MYHSLEARSLRSCQHGLFLVRLLDLRWPPSHCAFTRPPDLVFACAWKERVSSLGFVLIRILILLAIPYHLNYLSLDTVTLGVTASTYAFGGDLNQSVAGWEVLMWKQNKKVIIILKDDKYSYKAREGSQDRGYLRFKQRKELWLGDAILAMFFFVSWHTYLSFYELFVKSHIYILYTFQYMC